MSPALVWQQCGFLRLGIKLGLFYGGIYTAATHMYNPNEMPLYFTRTFTVTV